MSFAICPLIQNWATSNGKSVGMLQHITCCSSNLYIPISSSKLIFGPPVLRSYLGFTQNLCGSQFTFYIIKLSRVSLVEAFGQLTS